MRFSRKKETISSACHRFLIDQDYEYFKKTGISQCEFCDGTGLEIQKNNYGDYSWDTGNYCEHCNGTGHIGLISKTQIDQIHYVCKKCNGYGCTSCTFGIVDWVANAMG
jgi:DnaJ-class molecular chaperone